MSKLFRALLRIAALSSALFLLLILLLALASGLGWIEAMTHLVGGFGFFLYERLPRITGDAGTWAPGVAAWVVALALAHRLLRQRAGARGVHWRATTTICLGLLLPVLFATAFIVPGILLQVDGLCRVRWFEQDPKMQRVMATMDLRNLSMACCGFASMADDGKFPDSIDALVKTFDYPKMRSLNLTGDRNGPPELPIYLGAGYTTNTAVDAPLAISPRYLEDGIWRRLVVTIDGTMTTIRDDELDEWLDRVVPR